MSDLYYVDGYNVLHKSKSLRSLVRQDLESAREALLERVGQFCISTGARVIIVFDGRGRFRTEIAPHHLRVPRLEVQFAPEHLTADAVIERIIYQRANRMDAIVVSNDRGLRDLCRGMGALTMEADSFLATVRQTRAEMSDHLAPKRETARGFLEDQLDKGTLSYLEELRRKL